MSRNISLLGLVKMSRRAWDRLKPFVPEGDAGEIMRLGATRRAVDFEEFFETIGEAPKISYSEGFKALAFKVQGNLDGEISMILDLFSAIKDSDEIDCLSYSDADTCTEHAIHVWPGGWRISGYIPPPAPDIEEQNQAMEEHGRLIFAQGVGVVRKDFTAKSPIPKVADGRLVKPGVPASTKKEDQ